MDAGAAALAGAAVGSMKSPNERGNNKRRNVFFTTEKPFQHKNKLLGF
jgi:hypothetical protein